MTEGDSTEENRWGDIRKIRYEFQAHCAANAYPKIHNYLGSALGETFTDLDILFESTERTTFKKDAITILRGKINQLIMEEARDTTRPERIAPIMNKLALIKTVTESIGGNTERRDIKVKNLDRLEEAFLHTRKVNSDTVILKFCIHSLSFRKGDTFNPHNFDHIGNAEDPPEEAVETPSKVKHESQANTPISPELLAEAVAAGVATKLSTMGNPIAKQREWTEMPPASMDYFNMSILPDDVKKRIERRGDNNSLMTRKEMVPFKTTKKDIYADPSGNTYITQNYHYMIPNKIVTRDGTVFKVERTSKMDKKFVTMVPKLRSPKGKPITPQVIRMWYKDFTAHGLANQIFICPYYCFRTHVNDPKGFSCGKDTEHDRYDLPADFQFILPTWAGWIAHAIKDVFPEGSSERLICQSSGVNGYAALASIILPHHPAFYEYGPTLTTSPPYQQLGMDLQEYYNEYIDFLELRAYNENNTRNLNDFDQMTKFLSGCLWGDQILEKVREDRLSKNKKITDQFSQGQIMNTLKIVVERIDTRRDGYTSFVDPQRIRSPYKKPHKPRNLYRDFEKKRPERPDKTKKQINLLQAFDDLKPEIPSEAGPLCAIYRMGIDSAKATGFDISQKCMVCEESGHTFEDCPILKNHDLLKQIHIKFCSLCRQVRKKSKDSLSPSPQAVYQVQDHHSLEADDDYGSDDEEEIHFL